MTRVSTSASIDPSAADPVGSGFDPDRLARIDANFRRYVDEHRLPGWHCVITRRGDLAYSSTYGRRDVEAGRPWTEDTIARIYSMTKPLTSVALMMLEERALVALDDPVAKYVPAFADARVYRSGGTAALVTAPLDEPIRLWHLLTHTSGLTYGWHERHITDRQYRDAGFTWGAPPDTDLAAACERWARLPLVHQPGTEWNYGVSTDVVGRVVEVVSGRPLDEFLAEHVLGPLGMTETGFHVPPDQLDRAARLYSPAPGGRAVISPLEAHPTSTPTFVSGGGGLWGTAGDYLRFMHAMLGGGELDGVRLLGSRTVERMTSNHLPGGVDIESFRRREFSDDAFHGVGFGLGFSVTIDPIANHVPSSVGEYAWGGAASTVFWCDPAEELAVLFLTQLLPSGRYPIRRQLKQLVYQALVD